MRRPTATASASPSASPAPSHHHHHRRSTSAAAASGSSSTAARTERAQRVLKAPASDAAVVRAADTFEKMWRERIGTDSILCSIASGKNNSASADNVNAEKHTDTSSSAAAAAGGRGRSPASNSSDNNANNDTPANPFSDLPSAFADVPANILTTQERTSILSQFHGGVIVPRDLTRLRVGLSAALRVSISVPDEILFDLLVFGRLGANLLLQAQRQHQQQLLQQRRQSTSAGGSNNNNSSNSTGNSNNNKEVTVQAIIDVARWIKYQFSVHNPVDDAAAEDSPTRERLENALSEVADSVALFEAASFTHMLNKMMNAAAAAATTTAGTSAASSPASRFAAGAASLLASSPARSAATAAPGTGVSNAMRVTPRAALVSMQCEPPVAPNAGNRGGRLGNIFGGGGGRGNRNNKKAHQDGEKDDSANNNNNNNNNDSSSSDSDSSAENSGKPHGAARKKSGSSNNNVNNGSDDDQDDNTNNTNTNNGDDNDAESVADDGSGLRRTPSMLRSRAASSAARRRTHHHHHHSNSNSRQRSPDAEARKELRALMAADPWRQTAAALFTSLGGDMSSLYGTLPFPVIERVVRLMLHRRVDSAAVEGTVSQLGHKYNGRRLSLIEFDHDVVRPLARLLGCDAGAKGTQNAQVEDGISSQIRAAQHVIRLFMKPASKRDDRKKHGFSNCQEMLDAIKALKQRGEKRMKDIDTIVPFFDVIFQNNCILAGSGLTHILELSRFKLQDFVLKVKDNRPIAQNPKMALRRRILDRFINAVERAARLLHEHSSQCLRCNKIAETLRDALNAARQKETLLQRQETMRRKSVKPGSGDGSSGSDAATAAAVAALAASQQQRGDGDDDEEDEDDDEKGSDDKSRRTNSLESTANVNNSLMLSTVRSVDSEVLRGAGRVAAKAKGTSSVDDNSGSSSSSSSDAATDAHDENAAGRKSAFGSKVYGDDFESDSDDVDGNNEQQKPAHEPKPPAATTTTTDSAGRRKSSSQQRPRRHSSPFVLGAAGETKSKEAQRARAAQEKLRRCPVPPSAEVMASFRWNSHGAKKESDAVIDARQRSGQIREIARIIRIKNATTARARRAQEMVEKENELAFKW